jgi:uncharacterized protein YoxC
MKIVKDILIITIITLASAVVVFFYFVDKLLKKLKEYLDKDL